MEKQITMFGLPFSYYEGREFPIQDLSEYFSIPTAMYILNEELNKRDKGVQYAPVHRIELPNKEPNLIIEINIDKEKVDAYMNDEMNSHENTFFHAILINLDLLFSRHNTKH